MERIYQFEVNIVEDAVITSENKKEAIKRLKDIWLEESNIDLKDKEITFIAVEKVKKNKDGTEDITID